MKVTLLGICLIAGCAVSAVGQGMQDYNDKLRKPRNWRIWPDGKMTPKD